MSYDKLKELEDSLRKQYIELPEQEEAMIIDVSQKVGKDLAYKPGASSDFEFLDHRFKVKAMKTLIGFKQCFVLVFADENELNKAGYPRISKVTAEIDCNLTDAEILRAAVASFLRHKCGHVADVGEIE